MKTAVGAQAPEPCRKPDNERTHDHCLQCAAAYIGEVFKHPITMTEAQNLSDFLQDTLLANMWRDSERET